MTYKKKTNRILVYILFLSVLTLPVFSQDFPVVEPEAAGLSTERLSRIDKVIEKHIAEQKIAGGVILIARHGKIALSRCLRYDGCRGRKTDDARHHVPYCVNDQADYECRCDDAL